MLYLCDLAGTFAFAFVGAQLAFQYRLNLLGIITFASLTAVGGGTIRELLLQHTPFYFHDYTYLFMILIGVVCALIAHKRLAYARTVILMLDALGTVIFAFNGAYAAMTAQLGLSAMVLFAGLTAFGGGVLCDIIIRRTPRVFRSGIGTVPSFLLGGACWMWASSLSDPWICGVLLLSAYGAQLGIGRWPLLQLRAKVDNALNVQTDNFVIK